MMDREKERPPTFPSSPSEPGDTSIRQLTRRAIVLLGLLVLVSCVFFDFRFALSVALGGLLALLNFQWMKAGVDRILGVPGASSAGPVFLRFFLRLVLILVCLFAMIHFSFFSLIGAVLGLSIFVLAGTVEAVYLLVRNLK